MKLKFMEFKIYEREIGSLSQYHQIAFLASICERLIPLYQIFAKESTWKNASFPLIHDALNEVWLLIQNKDLNALKFGRLLIYCEEIIPDASSTVDQYVYEAEYAARAVCNILKFCLTSNDEFISRIIAIAHYIIYDYLNSEIDQLFEDDKSSDERNKKILNHSCTIKEIAKENKDLQSLKETSLLSAEFVQDFRSHSKDRGKHILDED